MNIQQSLNQALYQASVIKGIHSQTPEAKRKARAKELEKEIPTLSITSSEILENIDPKNESKAEAQTQLAERALEKEVAAKEELALLRPTSKNLEQASLAKSALIDQLSIRQEELKGTKEGMKERVQLLNQYGQTIGGNQ